jgi:single-strand DNA-binding protein
VASYNKVLLMGNLTRDPELRYTPSGAAVCEFAIAINNNYTTKQGEKREEVTFVDITAWARQAEICAEYLKKGRPVFVEGRLKQDRWEDQKTGQKRSKMSVTAERVQFLGAGGGGGRGGGGESEPPPAQEPPPEVSEDPPAENIPF